MARVTLSVLKAIAPTGKPDLMASLAPAIERETSTWTGLELAHFLAQACHETDGFRTLLEYGGPAYFKRYDGRKDLGNTQPGDGARFAGRGIFQLTGRANYSKFGKRLGLDLVADPERAADPETSVRIAVSYWTVRGLSAWANRDDVVEVTRRINGGRNGLADRRIRLAVAKKALALYLDNRASKLAVAIMPEEPDAPIAPDPAKKWFESTTVWAAVSAPVATLLGAVNTPWGFAALAVVVLASAWIIRERLRRDRWA